MARKANPVPKILKTIDSMKAKLEKLTLELEGLAVQVEAMDMGESTRAPVAVVKKPAAKKPVKKAIK